MQTLAKLRIVVKAKTLTAKPISSNVQENLLFLAWHHIHHHFTSHWNHFVLSCDLIFRFLFAVSTWNWFWAEKIVSRNDLRRFPFLVRCHHADILFYFSKCQNFSQFFFFRIPTSLGSVWLWFFIWLDSLKRPKNQHISLASFVLEHFCNEIKVLHLHFTLPRQINKYENQNRKTTKISTKKTEDRTKALIKSRSHGVRWY